MQGIINGINPINKSWYKVGEHNAKNIKLGYYKSDGERDNYSEISLSIEPNTILFVKFLSAYCNAESSTYEYNYDSLNDYDNNYIYVNLSKSHNLNYYIDMTGTKYNYNTDVETSVTKYITLNFTYNKDAKLLKIKASNFLTTQSYFDNECSLQLVHFQPIDLD